MMSTKNNDSFQTRVNSAVNGNYRPAMHRSIQALVLYEADRCLKDRYSSLKKPFQKKYTLLATAIDLLNTLDFIDDSARQKILFAGEKPLTPHQAWRRTELITKEIDQTFLPKAKELLEDEANQEKSHDDICEMLLQGMYEESSKTNKPRPPMWEYKRNHMFVVYRVYFCGLDLDSDLFAATPLRVVDVPDKKPANFGQALFNIASVNETEGAVAASLSKMTLAPGNKEKTTDAVSDHERRVMFKELKHQIDAFLGTFKGVVPDDELNKRKRVLCANLRLGRLNGGAKNQKQQQEKQEEAKFTGAETPEDDTEPPTTDDDWENVDSNDAKKQQRKAMREARREARRDGAKKQQKKAEEKAMKVETMDEN